MSTNIKRGEVSAFRLPKEKIVQLEGWLETKARNRKALEDPKRIKRITDPNVVAFVEYVTGAEQQAAQHQSHVGEIYWLYFRADAETRREFVEKLCAAKHLDPPDASATARQQLIHSLYGDDKEDVTPRNGSPDSPAAKRVTWAIRKFEERVGLRKVKARKTRATEILPRKTKDFLIGLYEKADKRELSMLNALIARVYGKRALRMVSSIAA